MTVVTMVSNSKSMLPPLCQILKSLCYSPVCCSVSKRLRQSRTVSALGAAQIMVGLFNIGLGPGRTSQHPDDFADLGAAYWLGGVFIATGIVSVFADQFPSLYLVGTAAFVNIVGSLVAIAGIVLYAMDLGEMSVDRLCDDTPSHEGNCRYVAYFLQRLLTAVDITMIVLASFQLCICINFTVLGIKALINPMKDEQGDEDEEVDEPLLTDVLMTSPGA